MSDSCTLCGEQQDLLNSHIIPNFVIKWLKKTSATGFLRTADDPNNRFQNYTEKLLCEKCEQIFNQYESPFAGYIFHPYVRNQQTKFEYDKWLKKFIISVSWRLIVSDRLPLDGFNQHHKSAINDAEDIWRKILTGESPLKSDPYSHYMILLNDLDLKTDSESLPNGWDFYMDRAIDSEVIEDGRTYIYFKLPHIAFFSFIQPIDTSGIYRSEISQSGQITTPQSISLDWESFFVDKVKITNEYDISELELEKIKEKIYENTKRLGESETIKTFAKEQNRKISDHNPTNYVGEDCPICFTKHKKLKSLPERPLSKKEIDSLKDNFEFIKGISIDDKLPNSNSLGNKFTSIVLSKENKTLIFTFYPSTGWLIENELEHVEDESPQEAGQHVWEETIRSYEEWLHDTEIESLILDKLNDDK
jgi:hypothetical protein